MMKTKAFIGIGSCTLICILFLGFGCKSKLEKELQGKWGIDSFSVNGIDYRFYTYCALLTFRGDGNSVLPTYENLHHDCCKWSVVGKDKVKLEGESTPFSGVYTVVMIDERRFIIQNDTLYLSASKVWSAR